jgi:hypothetical protein
MEVITKVSDITPASLAEYLRIVDADTNDLNTLTTLLGVAKDYVAKYTGRTIEDLDDYKDIVIVVMILVQDMWDNRTLYVDSSNVNKVVESVLGLHSVNLL